MQKAIVLFSGGQDSTTCLAWALREFDSVNTVGFNYGQSHSVELNCRLPILNYFRKLYPNKLGTDWMVPVSALSTISESALVTHEPVTMGENNLPTSFVPGRNVLFITFAAALAYRFKIRNIVSGVCQTDYSGYPDCRMATIDSLENTLSLAMEYNFFIQTPLMFLTKAQTWALAHELGGDDLINLIVKESHTCYYGNRETLHAWGAGCGICPACEIRAKGWWEYQETLKNTLSV